MKISKAISVLRNTIREYSDDSTFSDEYLYTVMTIFRNKYMSQRFRKFYNISDTYKTTFCTPTEVAFSHDCDCVNIGCKVIKSKYPIPSTLEGRNRDLIKVYTLDYQEIHPVTPDEQKTNMLDEVKAGQPTYSFLNRHIVLWNVYDPNKKPLKGILVEGVWEDETEWDGITLCDEQSGDDINSDNCFDLETAEFVIEADLFEMVIKESLQMLGLPLEIIQDNTNDANPDIKA